MKDVLHTLGEDLAALNSSFLEYRLGIVARPARPQDPWRIGVFFSSAERAWRTSQKLFTPTSAITVGVHPEKREAVKRAIHQMLAWCEKHRHIPRSELNPPFTTIAHTQTSESWQKWSDLVPWYHAWRRSLHQNLYIEITAHRAKDRDPGPWTVCLKLRNKLGQQKNEWHGVDVDLVEAFRQAGQQTFARFEEIQRIGIIGAQMGPLRERRLHTILCTAAASLPSWVRSARLATEREDRAGIDLMIESDIGAIPLQVKSSVRAKERFIDRSHHRSIACVIVHDQLSDEEVLQATIQALAELHERRRLETNEADT